MSNDFKETDKGFVRCRETDCQGGLLTMCKKSMEHIYVEKPTELLTYLNRIFRKGSIENEVE